MSRLARIAVQSVSNKHEHGHALEWMMGHGTWLKNAMDGEKLKDNIDVADKPSPTQASACRSPLILHLLCQVHK